MSGREEKMTLKPEQQLHKWMHCELLWGGDNKHWSIFQRCFDNLLHTTCVWKQYIAEIKGYKSIQTQIIRMVNVSHSMIVCTLTCTKQENTS